VEVPVGGGLADFDVAGEQMRVPSMSERSTSLAWVQQVAARCNARTSTPLTWAWIC
jgi:hypothetical protein